MKRGDPIADVVMPDVVQAAGTYSAAATRVEAYGRRAAQLESLKKEAFNLRFRRATGQLESTAQMRAVRRDAARVETILNEKARAAAASE